ALALLRGVEPPEDAVAGGERERGLGDAEPGDERHPVRAAAPGAVAVTAEERRRLGGEADRPAEAAARDGRAHGTRGYPTPPGAPSPLRGGSTASTRHSSPASACMSLPGRWAGSPAHRRSSIRAARRCRRSRSRTRTWSRAAWSKRRRRRP